MDRKVCHSCSLLRTSDLLRHALSSALLFVLLVSSLATSTTSSTPAPNRVNSSVAYMERIDRENCPLDSCFPRLGYCWFNGQCACSGENDTALCTAQCAVCMDSNWFRCCACIGLCALDSKPRTPRVTNIQRKKVIRYAVGGYRKNNRVADKGLLEVMAAAVHVMALPGHQIDTKLENPLSLGVLGVSVRDNTRRSGKRRTNTPATTAQLPTEQAMSESSTMSNTGTGETAVSTTSTISSSTPARENASRVEANVTQQVLEMMPYYRLVCKRDQCLTIYSRIGLARPGCRQLCDSIGAKTYHSWSDLSCECWSRCCNVPTGSPNPVYPFTAPPTTATIIAR